MMLHGENITTQITSFFQCWETKRR